MSSPNISSAMEDYARMAERFALSQGITLDYSEASLSQVDDLLEAIAGDGVLIPQSTDEMVELWMIAKAYGGYVGQVVIQVMGGSWELQDLPNGGSKPVLRCSGVQGFPAETVYKRLTEDRFSGVAGYCRTIRAIVARREK